jgi:hypothetical protein
VRLLTAPVVRRLVAGTWSLYWNGLVEGARPRPSAWSAGVVQRAAGLLAGRAGYLMAAAQPGSRAGGSPSLTPSPRVRQQGDAPLRGR